MLLVYAAALNIAVLGILANIDHLAEEGGLRVQGTVYCEMWWLL